MGLAPGALGAATGRRRWKAGSPVPAQGPATHAGGTPLGPDIFGDGKRRVGPAQPLTCPGDLGGAPWRAMRRGGPRFGRCPKGDRRAARNQARAIVVVGAAGGFGAGLVIMAVGPRGGPALRTRNRALVC